MHSRFNPLLLLPLACYTLASADAEAQPEPDTVVTKYEVVYTTIQAGAAEASPAPAYQAPTYNSPQPNYYSPPQENKQPAPVENKQPAPQKENKPAPSPSSTPQPSTQSTQPPPAGAQQYTSDSDFQKAILSETNKFRSEHGAKPLSWNDSLASYAQNHCNSCQFAHTGGPSGENLAAGYTDAVASIDTWGNERDKYNFASGGFDHDTGHFTQLVWKATTTVGCGKKKCDGSGGSPGWYVVCEYYPAGNVLGQFQQNVAPKTGGATSGGYKLKPRHVLGSLLGRRSHQHLHE